MKPYYKLMMKIADLIMIVAIVKVLSVLLGASVLQACILSGALGWLYRDRT